MPTGSRVLSSLARNAVVRFLAIGFVVLIALTFGTSYLAQKAADREALSEARTLHSVLALALAKPGISEGLSEGNAGDVDKIDRLVRSRFLENESLDVILLGINIWAANGDLVYSDLLEYLGQRFELGPEQRRVIAEGGTDEVLLEENIAAEANPLGRGAEAPVQIFTRVSTSSGTPLLFEGFYSLANLEERREQIYTPFRWISLAGMGTLLILVTPIIWVLTRDVRRAGQERERLLQVGLDASDAERRRMARDLHDGVVQDLAGVSFRLAALARSPDLTDDMRGSMDDANSSVRDSLKGLRALLSEIHPPEIQADGLPAALADLIAPAAAQGVEATVQVSGSATTTDERASLVLRVAQEAVRNCLRHAQASRLEIRVNADADADLLVLTVTDDGIGFDQTAARATDRYGLTGMSTLVRDRGGRLRVISEPGRGTEVRLDVRVREGQRHG